MVEEFSAERGAQGVLGERHPDCVRETLSEWSGGYLHAGRVVQFRMSRGARTPLPEILQVGALESEAGEMERGVLQDRGMTTRKHKSVPIRPCWRRGVVLHDAGEKRVGQRSKGHGCPWMPRVRPLRSVHREPTDDIDGSRLQL